MTLAAAVTAAKPVEMMSHPALVGARNGQEEGPNGPAPPAADVTAAMAVAATAAVAAASAAAAAAAAPPACASPEADAAAAAVAAAVAAAQSFRHLASTFPSDAELDAMAARVAVTEEQVGRARARTRARGGERAGSGRLLASRCHHAPPEPPTPRSNPRPRRTL
jgi:hypothetical protein